MDNKKSILMDTWESTQTVNQDVNSKILARLDKLEKENAQLKEISIRDAIQDRNKRYEWPRKYAIKMIGDKYITGYTMLSNKVISYWPWKHDVQQELEITFNDGTTQKMPLQVFAQTFWYSEHYFAESIAEKPTIIKVKWVEQEVFKKYYKFKIGDLPEFEVCEDIIN